VVTSVFGWLVISYSMLGGSLVTTAWRVLFREVGWDGMDWIDLAQDRDRWRAYVKAVMNLRVP
jgi:hypothetical protein